MVHIMNKKHFNDEEMQKLNERDGFLITKSLFTLLDVMNMEEKGITFTAIIDFVRTGEIMQFKVERSFPKVALDEFIRQYTKDREKYINKCKKNAENIKKRWDKEKNKNPQYP